MTYVNQVVYGWTQLSRRECTVSSTALRYVSAVTHWVGARVMVGARVIVLSSRLSSTVYTTRWSALSTWYESLTMPVEALVQALVSRDRSHIF